MRTTVVEPAPPARLRPRPGWHRRAACRGVGPALFFPEEGNRRLAEVAARSLCERCPVRVACADAGLEETHGIWGGADAEERQGWQADPAVMERAILA